MLPKNTFAHSPGKLIISGEHSVVYGAPALALAINKKITTEMSPWPLPEIVITADAIPNSYKISITELPNLIKAIDTRYNLFAKGKINIEEVLESPFELISYTIAKTLALSPTPIQHGMCVNIKSSLPISCGLGSSAAAIVSTIKACIAYCKSKIATNELINLATNIENLQHGNSSSLDVNVTCRQNALLMLNGKIYPRNIDSNFKFLLVNTGKPESSTGACISAVKPFFADKKLIAEFANTTNSIDEALKNKGDVAIKKGIQKNHQLLTQIGIVPKKVQNFIKQIEEIDGVGKICGAGSIKGDNAGAVLIIGKNDNVAKICKKFDYSCELLTIAAPRF